MPIPSSSSLRTWRIMSIYSSAGDGNRSVCSSGGMPSKSRQSLGKRATIHVEQFIGRSTLPLRVRRERCHLHSHSTTYCRPAPILFVQHLDGCTLQLLPPPPPPVRAPPDLNNEAVAPSRMPCLSRAQAGVDIQDGSYHPKL